MAKSKLNLKDIKKLLKAEITVELDGESCNWKAKLCSTLQGSGIRKDKENGELVEVTAASPNKAVQGLCKQIQGNTFIVVRPGQNGGDLELTFPDIIDHGLNGVKA